MLPSDENAESCEGCDALRRELRSISLLISLSSLFQIIAVGIAIIAWLYVPLMLTPDAAGNYVINGFGSDRSITVTATTLLVLRIVSGSSALAFLYIHFVYRRKVRRFNTSTN
jgi:hypothetical protein